MGVERGEVVGCVGKQSWLRCWCVERRRKAAVFKTVFLVGEVRQSHCFCAHGCSVLSAGEVLAGKERKAGVCQPYGVKVQQKARRRSGFACTGVRKGTAREKKKIFGWSWLSKAGRCRRSKRGHSCPPKGRKVSRGELASGFDWCRQSKVVSFVLFGVFFVQIPVFGLPLWLAYLKTEIDRKFCSNFPKIFPNFLNLNFSFKIFITPAQWIGQNSLKKGWRNKKYRKYQIWARLSSVLSANGEWELGRQLSA
ncbi:MAG: hypothetical protein GY820_46435, partial [Gammaproteobacteria bacterium]|nr:hypothetical protein [Gammaproteobacteria bacterium]